MYDLPIYVWIMVFIAAIGILATTSVVFYRGALAVGLSRQKAIALAAVVSVVLDGWLVISGLLARAGTYAADSGPWLAVAFTGVLVSLLLATGIPVMSRILAHPSMLALLAVPNTLRISGAVFLTVMALGHLPAIFALPAGLGDIAIGVTAPFIARRLARGDRRGAVRFHVLGLVDLGVALTIGFLFGLGPFRPFEVTPSTEPLAMLPLVLIPTVAVPLTIALHVVSLRRLRAVAQSDERQPGRLVPATS